MNPAGYDAWYDTPRGRWIGDEPGAPADARQAVRRAREAGVVIEPWRDDALDAHVDLVVDALLGLGAARAPVGPIADAMALIAAADRPVLAVDLPSGLHADTGQPLGEHCVRADATLAELGIGHLAQRITHRLSGGEKRLVCLAGLLVMQPDLLLLDEPTNGVDTENGRRLRAALQAYPGAMLLVSHDAGFVAEFATRALAIEDGTLRPAEIHTHPHTHSHPHIHPLPGEEGAS